MKRSIGAALVALMIMTASLSVANAAGLVVTSAPVFTTTASHPCSGYTATVVPANGSGTSYSALTTSVPGSCAGLPVQLTVLDGTATVVSGATVAAADGSVRLDVATPFTAGAGYTVQATVAGWALPAQWTFVPPVVDPYWCTVVSGPAGASCTVDVDLRRVRSGGWPWAPTYDYYYDVSVTTTSTARVEWKVWFKLDHSFYVSRPGFTRAVALGNSDLDGGDDREVERSSQCSGLPVLGVDGLGSGANGNNFRSVTNGTTRTFSLVVNAGTAYADTYWDVIGPGCT